MEQIRSTNSFLKNKEYIRIENLIVDEHDGETLTHDENNLKLHQHNRTDQKIIKLVHKMNDNISIHPIH